MERLSLHMFLSDAHHLCSQEKKKSNNDPRQPPSLTPIKVLYRNKNTATHSTTVTTRDTRSRISLRVGGFFCVSVKSLLLSGFVEMTFLKSRNAGEYPASTRLANLSNANVRT